MLVRKQDENNEWLKYISTVLGTTGVVLGAIALTKVNEHEDEENVEIPGSLTVDQDATVVNNLTVGTLSKNQNDVSKPQGLHLYGELDVNSSAFRLTNNEINTNLPFVSTNDMVVQNLRTTGNLEIDGKFVYYDVLQADDGIDVNGDLVVNNGEFAVYNNFGSGYVGLTIPVQSNSSILASTFHATSDVIVDGDLAVTGSFDYKSTLVASNGLDVVGTMNLNAGDVIINETKISSIIPFESTNDIKCQNMEIVSIFDVNTSAFRIDTKINTNLDFETSANVDITGILDVTGRTYHREQVSIVDSNILSFGPLTEDNWLLGTAGGILHYYSNGTPTVQFDPNGIRLNSGSFRALGGSASDPAFEIFPETGTGLFSPALNELGLSCNATSIFELRQTNIESKVPMQLPYGTTSAPSLTWAADPDTGLWGALANIHFASGGATVATFNNTNVSIIPDLLSSSYGFLSDATTGLESPAVGELDLKVGGVVVGHLTDSAYDSKVPILFEDGAQATPSVAFQTSPSTGLFYDSGDIVVSRSNSEVGRFNQYGMDLPPGGSIFNATLTFGQANTGLYSPNPGEIMVLTNGAIACYFKNTNLETTNPFHVPDGTNLLPSIAFASSESTGLYYPQLNTLGITCGTTISFFFNENKNESFLPVVLPTGILAAPTLHFTGDVDTGLYQPAAEEIALGCNGFQVMRWTENDVYSSARINVPSGGSPTNLALAINGDSNTGIYSPGADQLALVANGAQCLVTNATSVDMKLPIYAPVGLLTAPSYSFEGRTGIGMYSPALSTLALNVDGAEMLQLTDTKCTINGNVRIPDGTLTNLGLAFASDTDTGFYRQAANHLTLVTGAVQRLSFTPSYWSSTYNLRQFNGDEGTPAYSFTSGTGCGMWSPGNGIVAFSSGATERLRINTSLVEFKNCTIQVPDGTVSNPSIGFASDNKSGIYLSGSGGLSIAANSNEVVNFKGVEVDVKVPMKNSSSVSQKFTSYPGETVTISGADTHISLDRAGTINATLPPSSPLPNGHLLTIRVNNFSPYAIVTPDGSDKINGSANPVFIRAASAMYLYNTLGNWLILGSYTSPAYDVGKITSNTILPLAFRKYYYAGASASYSITLPPASSATTGMETTFIASSAFSLTIIADGSDLINGSTANQAIPAGESRKLLGLATPDGWALF